MKKKVKANTDDLKPVNLKEVPKDQKTKINGLGDVIAVITTALGIPTCADCEERRIKFNKMFPFTKVATRELNEEEITYINQIATNNTIEDIKKFVMLYNELYQTKTIPCNCPSILKSMLEKLQLQIEYQNIK